MQKIFSPAFFPSCAKRLCQITAHRTLLITTDTVVVPGPGQSAVLLLTAGHKITDCKSKRAIIFPLCSQCFQQVVCLQIFHHYTVKIHCIISFFPVIPVITIL